MELQEQIKLVAELRRDCETKKKIKEAMLDDWKIKNTVLLSRLDETTAKLALAEFDLREMTIKAFNETGKKIPALGVGIRETTKYDYEPFKALAWAKAHDMALKLDEAAFKKIIKADTPDFVSVSTEVTATIATDLSEYLKEEE